MVARWSRLDQLPYHTAYALGTFDAAASTRLYKLAQESPPPAPTVRGGQKIMGVTFV